MSDFVYKQMINKVTNLPIQGGIFFLRNVETLDDYDFDELPNDGTGSTQGRYVTTTVVPNGVYKIYRVVDAVETDTGDEVHVEPGRVMHGGLADDPFYPPVSRVVGDVVHVAGFIPDGATDTLASYITNAMTWAVANNYGSIKVGGYKGSNTWSGATTLTIPAGIIHIDLDGAVIACTGLNINPINNEAIGLHISDGSIQGNGTGSTPHVTSSTGILYTNVKFIGFGGGSPVQGYTTTSGGGTPTSHTVYFNCSNVRCDSGRRTRGVGSYPPGTQVAFGREYATDTGTGAGASERQSLVFADVDALELTQWIRAVQASPIAPPGNTAPFSSTADAAEALKHLWYTLKPYVDTIPSVISGINDDIDTAIAGAYRSRSFLNTASTVNADVYGVGAATVSNVNIDPSGGNCIFFTEDIGVDPTRVGKIKGAFSFVIPNASVNVSSTAPFGITKIRIPWDYIFGAGHGFDLPSKKIYVCDVTAHCSGGADVLEGSAYGRAWIQDLGDGNAEFSVIPSTWVTAIRGIAGNVTLPATVIHVNFEMLNGNALGGMQ